MFWFYFIAIVFSWTLFVITDFWLIPKYAQTKFVMLIALYGHLLAMIGPMLAGIIIIKLCNKGKLIPIKWNNLHYYIYSVYVMLIIWVIPGFLLLLLFGDYSFNTNFNKFDILFIVSYLLFGWFAGVGEEYGWSGYILGEITEKLNKSKAIIISGTLRGLWHLPLLTIPVIRLVIAGNKSIIGLLLLVPIIALQLIISNIFFGALFGAVWYKTKSIPLLGWMHFLFDLGRDFTLLFIIGYGGNYWFKFGWSMPFTFLAYLAFVKISKEDGYKNTWDVFKRKM